MALIDASAFCKSSSRAVLAGGQIGAGFFDDGAVVIDGAHLKGQGTCHGPIAVSLSLPKMPS
jgi:hypothetical protein